MQSGTFCDMKLGPFGAIFAMTAISVSTPVSLTFHSHLCVWFLNFVNRKTDT